MQRSFVFSRWIFELANIQAPLTHKLACTRQLNCVRTRLGERNFSEVNHQISDSERALKFQIPLNIHNWHRGAVFEKSHFKWNASPSVRQRRKDCQPVLLHWKIAR